MRASAIFILEGEVIEKMGKYGYNENVGTQHEGLVTKGDTHFGSNNGRPATEGKRRQMEWRLCSVWL